MRESSLGVAAAEALKCSFLPGPWSALLIFRCLGLDLHSSWDCEYLVQVGSYVYVDVYVGVSTGCEGLYKSIPQLCLPLEHV